MIRLHELTESQETFRVFHGSPYDDIANFRLHELHNRTGTPGTLSFTSKIDIAKIYGPHVYEAEVHGTFGNYQVPEDVEKVFDWRWARHKEWLIPRFKPETLEASLAVASKRLHDKIAKGEYAMWENVGLWKDMGWDGAWCFESEGSNLIIGNINCVRMIGLVA